MCIHTGLHLNNETSGTGLLAFFNLSGWAPVCFTDAFNGHAADVACQQLGYPFATNFSSAALPYDSPGIGVTGEVCGKTNRFGYKGYLFKCVNFTNMICQAQLHLNCYSKYNQISSVNTIIKIF